jgi:predicted pyridoxine 5'-phosphate oxidase superfamily flavin-nucleotide-binding protein
MRLTAEMKEMVERLGSITSPTVTPDGKPNLSPKGSLKVWDDETVVFADIASPGTMRNLRCNPFIEINLVDPLVRRDLRFKGRADVYESGSEFDLVAEALWSREGRQYPVNAVVKVTIEQAIPILSPVYMFDDKVSQEEVKAIWLKRYGVAARRARTLRRARWPLRSGGYKNSRKLLRQIAAHAH